MSAPAETEAKPVETVPPVVEDSTHVPAETVAPAEEYKKDEAPNATESETAAPPPAAAVVEETLAAAPAPAKEEETKTGDKPAETTIAAVKEEVKIKTGFIAKLFGTKKDKAPKSPKSPKKKEEKKKDEEKKEEKEEKKEEGKEEKKEEAAVTAEVPKDDPKPAEPAPAVEETSASYTAEPVKETETAPAQPTAAEDTKEESNTEKADEKQAEKKSKDNKIGRRFSTRITGIFKRESKQPKEETPAAVAEEAPPRLDEVAPAAPLEEPKTEAKVDSAAPAIPTAA